MQGVLHSLTLFALTVVTGVQQFSGSAPDGATGVAAIVPRHAARPGAVEIMRSSDGLFYVDAEVRGQTLRLLVDTGASMAVLTAADARRLGLPTRAGGGQIETVGGRVGMATTTVEAISIGAHRFGSLPAAVVGGGLSVSLIGQDLLSRFGSIRIEGDRLLLG